MGGKYEDEREADHNGGTEYTLVENYRGFPGSVGDHNAEAQTHPILLSSHNSLANRAREQESSVAADGASQSSSLVSAAKSKHTSECSTMAAKTQTIAPIEIFLKSFHPPLSAKELKRVMCSHSHEDLSGFAGKYARLNRKPPYCAFLVVRL